MLPHRRGDIASAVAHRKQVVHRKRVSENRLPDPTIFTPKYSGLARDVLLSILFQQVMNYVTGTKVYHKTAVIPTSKREIFAFDVYALNMPTRCAVVKARAVKVANTSMKNKGR